MYLLFLTQDKLTNCEHHSIYLVWIDWAFICMFLKTSHPLTQTLIKLLAFWDSSCIHVSMCTPQHQFVHAILLLKNSSNGKKTLSSTLQNTDITITSLAKTACSFNSSFAVISAADDVCAFFNASSNSALTLLNMSRKLFVCASASLVTFALVAFRSWFRAWRVATWDLYSLTSCSAALSLLSVVTLNSSLVYKGKEKVSLFMTMLKSWI